MDLCLPELQPYRPRSFLPASLDLNAWQHVEMLYDELERRGLSCKTSADLEEWIIQWSELTAALAEEVTRHYISVTCDTSNLAALEKYKEFLINVQSKSEPRHVRMCKLFCAQAQNVGLACSRYEVLLRDSAISVRLFREENIELEIREANLCQEHLIETGSKTVRYNDEDLTPQELSKYLENPDRSVRHKAWELTVAQLLSEAPGREERFESLLEVRHQIAQELGFANYREYAWVRLKRTYYNPAQCEQFHIAIEKEVLPVVLGLQRQRAESLGLDVICPWDTEVDPAGKPPLRPFIELSDLVSGAQSIFDRMDVELASQYRYIRDKGLLFLENRKGKASGAYCAPLCESRLPFVFLNTVGMHSDILNLFHECGHAFHTIAMQSQDILAYRCAPAEFCEIASQSMELIGSEFLDVMYSPSEKLRARRSNFERILLSLLWVATVDAFQHWVYTSPGHTRSARKNAWLKEMKRFGGLVNWSGYESTQEILWQDVVHIFESPFYFIEYGIAWLGALQIWSNWRDTPERAMRDYKDALKLGGSCSLVRLFETAGCELSFDQLSIRSIVTQIREEIKRY